MADFRTHLIGGTVAGLGLAVAGIHYEPIGWSGVPLITLACAIGGIAPDVDSDSGRPQRILFGLGALLVPSVLLWRLGTFGPDLRGLGAWALGALLVWFPARWIFRSFTAHRGMFHSAPAALIFGSICFLLGTNRIDTLPIQMAVGVAGAAGYLVHLLLDELWSVDFEGKRIRVKRSRGTALKLMGTAPHHNLFTWGLAFGLGTLVWLGCHGTPVEDLVARVRSLHEPAPAVHVDVRERTFGSDQPEDTVSAPLRSRSRAAASHGS